MAAQDYFRGPVLGMHETLHEGSFMRDDVRYSELVFLQHMEKSPGDYFNPHDAKKLEAMGLNQTMCVEMVVSMLEDLYVRFDDDELQRLVGRLRGEVAAGYKHSHRIAEHDWDDPRDAVFRKFTGPQIFRVRITYRGLRRIDELREMLKRDRILEDFGILLSIRYFRADLRSALQRSADTAVSVLYFDMDGLKQINTDRGHLAGDEVMRAYLSSVKEVLGDFGVAYRGLGDEVAAIIIGQGHQKAIDFGESIRRRIEGLRCAYAGNSLPAVTVSVGAATAPPDIRASDIETIAQNRMREAKGAGRNRLVSS